MNMVFKMENEVKREYLDTKPTGTAESEFYVLSSADEYENLIGKPIYNMSYSELRRMIAVMFRNTSVESVSKNVSILRTYINFCISKNLVAHGENRLATFTYQEAKNFVSRQALVNRYPSKERIKEYQKILYNEQDKLLIELVFLGVRGRTTKDGTMEEIINLRMSDIDEDNNTITLTKNNGEKRILEVTSSLIELIKDTYNQEKYVENNGEQTANLRITKGARETVINKVEDYVFRIPGLKKFKLFTPTLLNNRMRRYQNWLDNVYLTFNSIYFAGILNMAMEIYKSKEEITKADFEIICDKFNYDIKYYSSLKTLFEQYRKVLE